MSFARSLRPQVLALFVAGAPVLGQEAEPTVPTPGPAAAVPKIYFVLAALTDDPSIGRFIEVDVQDFDLLISTQVQGKYLGSYTKILGSECKAAKITETIEGLPITAADTLFVYYEGHGAYDESLGTAEPGEDHFFALPGLDLPRKRLLGSMLAKNARLTVLMSDCCNAEAIADVPLRALREEMVATVDGWTATEELLLGYQGVVDVTAASRDELSWFSIHVGGWFTTTFHEKLYAGGGEAGGRWDAFWPELSSETEAYFQEMKESYAGQDPALDAQDHMTPMDFRLDVSRVEGLSIPTERRHIAVPVTVLRAADE